MITPPTELFTTDEETPMDNAALLDLARRIEVLEARLGLARPDSGEIVPHRLYVAQEVAELLGCSLANAYGLMERGEIAVTRVGAGRTGAKRGFRVMGSDLITFLEANREGGPTPAGGLKHLPNHPRPRRA